MNEKKGAPACDTVEKCKAEGASLNRDSNTYPKRRKRGVHYGRI